MSAHLMHARQAKPYHMKVGCAALIDHVCEATHTVGRDPSCWAHTQDAECT